MEREAMLAAKRAREIKRRKKFTPEQKAQAAAHVLLYVQHRRLTDATYLQKVRDNNRKFHKKHSVRQAAAMRKKHWESRIRCLSAYSKEGLPECVCCGENILQFLTLDHIIDRKHPSGIRVGGDRIGQNLFSWLIRMEFPPGLQVLCYNCNCAKGTHGRCPHETLREIEEAG